MLKKDARKLFREKRKNLSVTDQMRFDDLILIQFQTVELPFLDHVLSYYPVEDNKEVDSFLLTDHIRFRNPAVHICYPRTDVENEIMEAVVCRADTVFAVNSLNLYEPLGENPAEPTDIDLVILPLMAFDETGIRVGYGKGYYDKFLSICKPDVIKIGVSYFEALDVIDDPHEYDIPLDFCITPNRVYVF